MTIKFITPNTWTNSKNGQALQFFASIFEETVNNRAWESYKAYSLCTIQKLREIRVVSQRINTNEVSVANIKYCAEEATSMLSKDPVANDICNFDLPSFLRQNLSKNSPLEEISTAGSFLQSQISKKYKERCEKLLLESLFKEKIQKETIQTLCRLYASHLITLGFSKRYLYRITNEFFYKEDLKRCGPGTLRSFFGFFTKNKNDYKVYLPATRWSSFYKKLGAGNVIADKDSLPTCILKEVSWNNLPAFIVIDVEASDEFSAFEKAFENVEVFQSLSFALPINHQMKVRNEGYVIKKNCRSGRKIEGRNQTTPIWNEPVGTSRKVKSNQTAVGFFSNIGLLPKETSSLIRASNAAALVTKTTSPVNQLVSIWSALETLTPPSKKENGRRIDEVKEFLVPCINSTYITDMIIEFDTACTKNFGESYKSLFELASGDLIESKWYRCHALGQALINRDSSTFKKLDKYLSKNCAAGFRLEFLSNKFVSSKIYKKFRWYHSERLSWQIQRLYRERNSLVHNNKPSPFLDSLVSNGVHYYRKTVDALLLEQLETQSKRLNECSMSIKFREHEHLQSIDNCRNDDEAFKNEMLKYLQHHLGPRHTPSLN